MTFRLFEVTECRQVVAFVESSYFAEIVFGLCLLYVGGKLIGGHCLGQGEETAYLSIGRVA